MKRFSLCGFIAVCVLLSGCGGFGTPAAPTTPAPLPTSPSGSSVDVMRPGDKITIRLSGVPDDGYVVEIQIPASGDINVALLTQSFHAAGRNSAELAAEITEAYKTSKIYTNPNVTVISEERYVNVGGDVRGPSRVLWTPDMTLLTAINSCGGFDEYANKKAVRITRGQQIFTVDAVQATRVAGTDPKLYPGDQVFIPRTIF